MRLSERFKALSPLHLDEYRAIDVFRMIRDLNNYTDKNENNNQNENIKVENNSKRIIVKVLD